MKKLMHPTENSMRARLMPKKTRDRRAKVLFCIIALFFTACVGNLIRIQVIKSDYYKTKAEQTQLYDNTIPAQRGTIYDATGKVLAQSASVWLVYIDPYSVQDDTVRAELCKDLSEALDIDGDRLMRQLQKTHMRYIVIAKQVEYETKEKVAALKKKIYTYKKDGKDAVFVGGSAIGIDPDVKRYYPNGKLASHVIGYTNSSGLGQAGIELYYEDMLAGIPGRKVTAKDANGRAMPLQYETLYDPQQGRSFDLTIDHNIQRYLEEALEQAYIDNKCAYANGIVMDVNTGAVLAMATKSDYDPNSPRDLDEAKVEEEYKRLQELRAAKYEEEGKTPTDEEIKEGQEEDRTNAELNVLYDSVRNQNVSSTYEPGSVFKTITASAALDQGVADQSTKVDCVAGGIKILTQTYHCNAHTVHGTLDMTGGLKKSCNSYFITMGQRLGVDNFYKYFEAFGFTEKTGIDLPAETQPKAGVTYHAHDSMTLIDLASSSFGQSFQVTPIQMITALSTIANGGKLMKPYVVAKIRDSSGNVIKETQPTVRRQVISEETSAKVAEMMRRVVNEGTAKNGYVIGYRVAGKTGTSQKLGKTGEHVASYGCFAPADDPKVAIIIVIDEPHGGQIQGGQIAAPVAAQVMEKTLKYLNVEPQYTESELANLDTTVSNYVGKSVNDVSAELASAGFICKVIGSGEKVVSQLPGAYQSVPKGGIVVLYTEGGPVETKTVVPNLSGLSITQVNRTAAAAGINVKISGNTLVNSELTSYGQSVAAGESVDYGTTVTVYFKSNTGVSDLPG